MKSLSLCLMIATIAVASPASAKLTPEEEGKLVGDLTECFRMKTTGEDRVNLARWFMGGMASLPQMKDFIVVNAEVKDGLDRKGAAIFTRLFTVDCLAQSSALAKGGSAQSGFRAAGEALGKMAVAEAFNDPRANEVMSSYLKYLDENEFKKIMK